MIADDGPCNQLRKHGNIGSESNQVLLRLRLSPVYVNGIRHGLKSVERNSHRKRQPQKRQLSAQNLVCAPDQKIGAFKKAQKAQVNDDRRGHRHPGHPDTPLLLKMFYQLSVKKIHQGGKQEQGDINGLSPSIKNKASNEENAIAKPCGHQIIGQYHSRQKPE